MYWDNPNPDLICECDHKLRYHTLRFYQDMQAISSLFRSVRMFPVGESYEEWSCEDCTCKQWIASNLRYLEHKASEKGL